jgi:glycosyltransferase involved in cell wall biosynthesis
MKIAHVISYFQPKLGYSEFYHAKEQQKMGHEVCVITSDRYAPRLYPAAVKILGPRKKGSGYFIEEAIKTWRLPILFEVLHIVWLRGLREKLLKVNPDVIICHGILSITSIRLIFLKRLFPNSKLIFDDSMVFDAMRRWTGPLYKLFGCIFGRTITRIANVLIATQLGSVKFMNEVYGIPLERITLIPLGCDTKLFHRSQEARQEIRSHYKISNKDIVFVYAGKLIPEKGVHIFVESAINLLREHTNIKVTLIGSGETQYIKIIKEKIACSCFQDKFIFIPMVPHKELYKYYSSGDIGVWPKQCSLTMVEAMACGLPVIIADDSGVPDRVGHKNGLMYRSGDVEDLKEKMKILLDQDTRKKMQRNATEYAQKLDWAIISRKFLETIA